MQMNRAVRSIPVKTAGGAPAYRHTTPLQLLRRSVMSCLLWESEFYQDGKTIVQQIEEAAAGVTADQLAMVALEARTIHNLRHVPLLLLTLLVKKGGGRAISDVIANTIQRADEPAELLSMYWKDGKRPLAKQLKLGLAKAIQKFDAYALAKYDREKAVKLRDVLFMVHAKPKDEAQAALWKSLVDGTLAPPETWEVLLSAGADKRATWESLLRERKLGYLALLRNLRNMTQAGVSDELIRDAILARRGADRVLPFRYVAAARACPQMEPALDEALSEAISGMPALNGKTLVLVDVSGSMDVQLSGKSDLRRIDAAAALASIIHGDLRVFSFSNALVEVPPRRGMAGVDAIIRSQRHGGTALAEAVMHAMKIPHDRMIVITDEQATTGGIPQPSVDKAYMINVASARNGVGYGKWKHIDGFSEGVLRWIAEYERDA